MVAESRIGIELVITENETSGARVMDGDLKSDLLARRIVLAIALLMTFRTFQFFPGMLYVQEIWFALCFLASVVVYPAWKIGKGLRFSFFEVYILTLMLAAAVLSAWRAWHVFGQPIVFGLLAQRGVTLMVSSLLLVNALRYRLVRLADVEGALLLTAWGTFFLFSAIRLLFSPSSFAGHGIGFVTQVNSGDEPSFTFSSFFLVFGALYYATLAMRTRRAKYYLMAAVLFTASLGASGRGLSVCVAATLLFFLYRLRGLRQMLVTAVKFGLIAAILVGVLYAIFPGVLSARIAGFSDAFTVLLTGSQSQDDSANARIFETLTALPYIQEHPLLGNGVVSNQWQGGNEGALGEYFHTTDIGVIGVVFAYGVLGLLLFSFQYKFAWSAARKLPDSFHSPLFDATKAFVLYTALYSLASGMCALYPEVSLFFVALLGGIAAQATSESVYGGSGRKCSLQRPVLSA